MGFTSRVLRVDPSERRTTALVASLMFMSLAGAAIGESGINALFFDRIGTEALPLMYLAQAGSTLVAMFALTATLERVRHRSVYVWSPVLLAAVVLAERGVVLTGARWIYPVMWVTVAFATLAQAIGLWGTAGAVVDARQAKRLFPIFGAGGILGSVVGGLAHAAPRRRARRGEPAARLGRRSARGLGPVPALARPGRGGSSGGAATAWLRPRRPQERLRATSSAADC